MDISYWHCYGFCRDPFIDLAQQELYLTPSWERLIDFCSYIFQTKNVLVVLDGPEGAGKTTFLNYLISQIKETLDIYQITARTDLQFSEIINLFKVNIINQDLDVFIERIQYTAKTQLLIIDNCENLSQDILEKLVYLIDQQSQDQMRLHILLVGQMSKNHWIHNLKKVQLKMPSFNLAETVRYLHYRLKNAGLIGRFPLSHRLLKRIYHSSQGIPKKINRLGKKALMVGVKYYWLSSALSFLKLWQTRFLGIGCFLLVIACLFIFWPKPRLAPLPRVDYPPVFLKTPEYDLAYLESFQKRWLFQQSDSKTVFSEQKMLSVAKVRTRYTIQLIVLSNTDHVRSFVRKYPNLNFQISSILLNGQSKYRVSLGYYPDSFTAQAVLNRLPSELKSLNPMIKKLPSNKA